MVTTTKETARDALFAHAEAIMDSLDTTFTANDFLFRLIRDYQQDYLAFVDHFREETQPLAAANRAIIEYLREIAIDFGYQATNQGRVATDIFGNKIDRVLFNFLAC
ncbi:MAG: hypothetical protein D6737_19380 [Chloroflexi bacterium]|nr:MAG: hypothetical protein D6737_19380 [Chloroflexota bacterium]